MVDTLISHTANMNTIIKAVFKGINSGNIAVTSEVHTSAKLVMLGVKNYEGRVAIMAWHSHELS
jgi:hypothetical protein